MRIAATIWDEAGGKGRGVHWDNYKSEDRGKLLDMITMILAQVIGEEAANAEKRGIAEAIKNPNKRQ